MRDRRGECWCLTDLTTAACGVAGAAYLLTFPGFRYWTATAALAFSGLTVLALLLSWTLLPEPDPPGRW